MDEEEPGRDPQPAHAGRKRVLIIVLSILGAIGLFAVLCVLFPSTFYDGFLYKYYIKSFIEDGSYNPIDTTTYGLMIAAAIFGIYRMLGHFRISVDRRAIYVIIPWMLIGGTYRVLEDSEFFRKPVIYLFRSPMIYLVIAATVLLILLYSIWVQLYSSRRKSWRTGFLLSVAMLGLFDVLYLVFYLSSAKGVSYRFTPLYPFLLSVLLAYPVYVDARRRGYADVKTNVLVTGLFFLFLSVLPIIRWPGNLAWKEHYLSGYYSSPELKWGYFLLVLAIALLASLALWGLFFLLKGRYPKLSAYTGPISFLIMFGHFLDASATSVGMEYFGYVEKHFVPDLMISLTGTPFVMFLLKLPLVLLVIYVLDIAYGKEFRENEDLLNLVKMGIIILGLAPGLRDVLRMAMGV